MMVLLSPLITLDHFMMIYDQKLKWHSGSKRVHLRRLRAKIGQNGKMPVDKIFVFAQNFRNLIFCSFFVFVDSIGSISDQKSKNEPSMACRCSTLVVHLGSMESTSSKNRYTGFCLKMVKNDIFSNFWALQFLLCSFKIFCSILKKYGGIREVPSI